MRAHGKQVFVLLRGRVQSVGRVHEYQRRRVKHGVAQRRAVQSGVQQRHSNVLILAQHPVIRREPGLQLLGKLEPVLRELQKFLRGAKDNALCIPDNVDLYWTTTSDEVRLLEREFQYSIWEGTRAFEEGNTQWAGLCWRSASLRLEDLLWQPDLDIWTTILRCCIRLKRSGAEEVGKCLHRQLRMVRHSLPMTAPHRALLFALTDANFDEIVQGGLFILEAKLRQIELLWPKERNSHITYQFNLAEERFYHGHPDMETEMPRDDDFSGTNIEEVWERVKIFMSHILKYMLLFEHQKAEVLAQRYITELGEQCQDDTANPLMRIFFANLYARLGNAQYYQERYIEARSSYSKSLQIHQASLAHFAEYALDPLQVHRILSVLSYLDTHQTSAEVGTTCGYDAQKRVLEVKLQDEVEARGSRLWTPQIPKANPLRTKDKSHQNLIVRTRVASIVTAYVPNRDKVHAMPMKPLKVKPSEDKGLRNYNQKSSASPGQKMPYEKPRPRPCPPPSANG